MWKTVGNNEYSLIAAEYPIPRHIWFPIWFFVLEPLQKVSSTSTLPLQSAVVDTFIWLAVSPLLLLFYPGFNLFSMGGIFVVPARWRMLLRLAVWKSFGNRSKSMNSQICLIFSVVLQKSSVWNVHAEVFVFSFIFDFKPVFFPLTFIFL